MSTFFQQTAQAMIAKHIDRFPLLKLDQVIDWQPIEQYLNRQRTRYLRDHRGRPAYPLLSMFKAVLLGQWHSLSDPELEHSLITRIDFNLFCRFDELSIPDYSTLCRYRNWLAQDDTLSELLELINRQLTEKNLKIDLLRKYPEDLQFPNEIRKPHPKKRQGIQTAHRCNARPFSRNAESHHRSRKPEGQVRQAAYAQLGRPTAAYPELSASLPYPTRIGRHLRPF